MESLVRARVRPRRSARLSSTQPTRGRVRPRRFVTAADEWGPPVSTAFVLPPLKLGSLALPPACHAAAPEPPQASSTTPEESQGLYLSLEPFHSLSFVLSRPQSLFLLRACSAAAASNPAASDHLRRRGFVWGAPGAQAQPWSPFPKLLEARSSFSARAASSSPPPAVASPTPATLGLRIATTRFVR